MNAATLKPPACTAPAVRWEVERDPGAGVVWVRAAGNLDPQPADWRARLAAALTRVHGVAAAGAKRLTPEGRVFSMGEFVIHPKGFHHLGKGVLPHAYRFPEEVDAIAGGLLAVEAAAFDQIQGEAALAGDLGPLELCLRLRRAGRRCLAVPEVVVTDTFTPAPSAAEAEAFRARWGFDWQAADLDAVRAAHAGTGLLWHPRLHAAGMPFDKYQSRPAVHWTNYRKVDVYRQRADHLANLARQLAPAGLVLDLGCGDGLFSHLLAQRGLRVQGVDPEPAAVEQAHRQTCDQAYPAEAPAFEVGRGDALPAADGAYALVLMLDVIEHLPNPLAVLREVRRVLAVGGRLLVTTPAWQYGGWSDPFYHVSEYTPEELARQLSAGAGFAIEHTGKIGGVYRDVVMVAKRAG